MVASEPSYYKLVYEMSEAPGSRLFTLYKTKEKAEERLRQLQKDYTIIFFEIIEIE